MEGRLGEGTHNWGGRRFTPAEIDLRDVLKQELEAAALEFPCNRLARAYRLGEPNGPEAAGLPEKFGGDCLEQVKRLREKLKAQGVSSDGILCPNDMHFALIVPEGETDYYLDPSVNAVEPVDLSDGQRPAQTYPRLDGQWSTLTASMTDRLTSTWAMVEGVRKVRTFNPKIEDLDKHNDLGLQRTFFSASDSLEWNTIDPKTGKLLKLKVPKQAGSALSVRITGLRGSRLEGKHDEFAPIFGRIVECSGESEATVREFIEEARNRWRAFSTQL